jgi:eukaryotic-like serine/threonine-protein kinase
VSDPAAKTVHRICPSCDAEQPTGPMDEPVCAACGARLVELDTEHDDLLGTVLDGRYEIRSRLGEGGMGTVYRAWQRSIGREVAIKLIDKRYGRDVMAVKRFLREARLASQLSQPSTVSVFDFGQASGRLFISMELVRGRTLDQVLAADGPMSVARAARIGIQLCDALEAAHNLKIVHRDLKLANVMLLDEPPGRDLIKVLDFGLAKSLGGDESTGTQTGIVVGTPRYMSPEAATGAEALPTTDLYAVGVMLGELTTGKYLWEATGLAQLVAQKLAPSPVIGDVPAPLRSLVNELIDFEPARRPQSATEVRERLQRILEQQPSGSRGAAPVGEVTMPLKATSRDEIAATVPLLAAPRSQPLAPAQSLAVPVSTDRPTAAATSGVASASPSEVVRQRSSKRLAIGALVAAIVVGGVAIIAVTRDPGGKRASNGAAPPPAPESTTETPQSAGTAPAPPTPPPGPSAADEPAAADAEAAGLGVDLQLPVLGGAPDAGVTPPPRKKRPRPRNSDRETPF